MRRVVHRGRYDAITIVLCRWCLAVPGWRMSRFGSAVMTATRLHVAWTACRSMTCWLGGRCGISAGSRACRTLQQRRQFGHELVVDLFLGHQHRCAPVVLEKTEGQPYGGLTSAFAGPLRVIGRRSVEPDVRHTVEIISVVAGHDVVLGEPGRLVEATAGQVVDGSVHPYSAGVPRTKERIGCG